MSSSGTTKHPQRCRSLTGHHQHGGRRIEQARRNAQPAPQNPAGIRQNGQHREAHCVRNAESHRHNGPCRGSPAAPTQKHCAEHPKSAGARSAPNPRPRATTAGKRRAVCMRLAPSTSATKADGTVLSTHRNASQTKPWAAGAARHPKHRFPPPTPANAGGPVPRNHGGAQAHPTAVQETPACRSRPAGLATRGCHHPLPQAKENGIRPRPRRPVTLTSCPGKLMARIRDAIESQLAR
ncbi:hypothetical protein TCDM_13270 [Trypanosoma cruzi Dm28c]|uniref:Uncharacterized protein n=1 Tax=Trypanosoma cruzi Dm28c TaxID=1416333 RepID=V5A3A9_TRYCR|nr:hypothetical protein TCDM_13270 [Trypanosoma cruzi Dm28c]